MDKDATLKYNTPGRYVAILKKSELAEELGKLLKVRRHSAGRGHFRLNWKARHLDVPGFPVWDVAALSRGTSTLLADYLDPVDFANGGSGESKGQFSVGDRYRFLGRDPKHGSR